MTTRFVDKRIKEEAWFLPWKDKACYDLEGIRSYVKMAVHSIGMTCLMMGSFESMIFLSALISI